MAKHKKGEGRGLEAYEVAIIKNLRQRRMPRDLIMSFIIRPGRKLSPAAVDEVRTGRIGADIQPASDHEADAFMRRRMEQSRAPRPEEFGGPTSQIRVNEVLRVTTKPQASFSALEGKIVEFKETLPVTRQAKAAVAKTMAAYANAHGGYIFFGIRDDRSIAGLSDSEKFSKACDDIGDVVTQCFCPEILWDKGIVLNSRREIGVIYVYVSENKPVVAMANFEDAIKKSSVYYRYEGKSTIIEPGDFLHMVSGIRSAP